MQQRTSAFGSRRFPLPGDESRASTLGDGGAVPESWDEGSETPPTGSAALNGEALSNEPDLAASVLGSLALDDPSDDALLGKPAAASGAATPSRAAPPPGLGAFPPAEAMWQYRDPSGQVQGPFSASMMHDWYRQQFFTPDLRVKRTTDADFESLENLIRRTGDQEKPFLAPKPSAPTSAFSSAPGTPQGASSWGASSARAQTPLEQLTAAVAQGRFGGSAAGSSLYEPFGSAAPSPAPEPQTLPQPFGQAPSSALDPWGAPLPSAGGAASWNGLGGAALGQPQQHQQLFQQQQPLPSPGATLQSPMDLLRQLAQQQQQQQSGGFGQQQPQFGQQGMSHDMFGRPSLPASPFFDPSQLAPGAGSASPGSWLGQQLPQQQQQQHMQQPGGHQQQQPWASLTGNAAAMASPLAQFAQAPGANVPSPIGRSAQMQSPLAQPAQQQSPWDSVNQQQQAPVEVAKEAPRAPEPEAVAPIAAPPAPAQPQEAKAAPAPVEAPKQQPAAKAASPAAQAKAAPAPAQQAASPSPSPSPAPSSASKAGASAPWAKEEKVAAVAPAAPSPSLREIQEAEARDAAKRKEAARIQAAQANVQAAQRAAALEAQAAAETLPSSASWAAGPAQVPAPKAPAGSAAPWVKPAAAASPVAANKTQKSLKEIQEEEEKRKKAQLAAQQQAGQPAAGKGYAGTAQAAPQVGGAWTTVAVKPAVVARPAAAGAKPVVPGLPSTATNATGARTAGATGLPVKPAATAAPAARPAAAAVITAAVPARPAATPRSVNVNGSSATTTVYDMENPPPPSPEFLSWTKQALKGLNVPRASRFSFRSCLSSTECRCTDSSFPFPRS